VYGRKKRVVGEVMKKALSRWFSPRFVAMRA